MPMVTGGNKRTAIDFKPGLDFTPLEQDTVRDQFALRRLLSSIESMKINQWCKQMHPKGGVWRMRTAQRRTTRRPSFHDEGANQLDGAGCHSVRMQFGSWVVWLGTCMGGDSTPWGAKAACHSGVFSSMPHLPWRMVRRRKGGCWRCTSRGSRARDTVTRPHGEPAKSIGQQPFILWLHQHPLKQTLHAKRNTINDCQRPGQRPPDKRSTLRRSSSGLAPGRTR